jgi:hypothetical protein
MASWRKRLQVMADDPNPCNYTYDDAAGILSQLGFALASKGGSSHRKWRRKDPGLPAVTIGLVDKGAGRMRKEYILDMIASLRRNNLLPPEVG